DGRSVRCRRARGHHRPPRSGGHASPAWPARRRREPCPCFGTIGDGRLAAGPAGGYASGPWNLAPPRLDLAILALRYDLREAFEPGALVSSDPLLIVARKTMPADDLNGFVAWLKAKPDRATQGTTGAGGISTVGGLFFRRAAGTQFRCVPYRGGLGP